jgi:hypothetical protein
MIVIERCNNFARALCSSSPSLLFIHLLLLHFLSLSVGIYLLSTMYCRFYPFLFNSFRFLPLPARFRSAFYPLQLAFYRHSDHYCPPSALFYLRSAYLSHFLTFLTPSILYILRNIKDLPVVLVLVEERCISPLSDSTALRSAVVLCVDFA